MATIYVSIASYRDRELTDTVYALLSQSKYPQNIYVSVFDQDEEFPKLENIFGLFNMLGYNHDKISYLDAKGVGYARHMAQKRLDTSFDYYLQVDSHTQFIKDWDDILVSDYIKSEEYWGGDIIFTSYPEFYLYDDFGNKTFSKSDKSSCLRIQTMDDDRTLYEPKYKTCIDSDFGNFHAYFCAGFAFGRAGLFLKVPYDKDIYFSGEEQTMSVRFFCNDIKLISPPRNYSFHHYDGHKRDRHWEKNPDWLDIEKASGQRLRAFWAGDDLGGYGIPDMNKYKIWQECFVRPPIV